MITIESDPGIVLAHDSFTQWGGAERVVAAMHELYPQAPVYTLAAGPEFIKFLKAWDIRTSWLQFFYRIFGHFQWFFPLAPAAVKGFKFPLKTSIVVSSSSSYIKALRTPKSAVHINYCHTPTRFIWTDTKYALSELPMVIRPVARAYFAWLRRWDFSAAQRVSHFIANSREVQSRIKKYYRRDSTVIYPFVDTKFWRPSQNKQNYFLIAGRLQPYKNNDAVIKAFTFMGLELHVVGTGRQEAYLKSVAGPTIKFLGQVSDEVLRSEYSGALGYIFPQLEDFGIGPLEAAACGTATLGLAHGGSLETVVRGVTGQLIDKADSQSIMAAVKSWKASDYESTALRAHAEQFSKQNFMQQLSAFVHDHSR